MLCVGPWWKTPPYASGDPMFSPLVSVTVLAKCFQFSITISRRTRPTSYENGYKQKHARSTDQPPSCKVHASCEN